MDTRTLIFMVIGIFGSIIGVYVFVFKHLANAKKHPCKDDIVFRDVCDERSKRLEDCIEGAVKAAEGKYSELKKDMKSEFKEVKELIRNNGRGR